MEKLGVACVFTLKKQQGPGTSITHNNNNNNNNNNTKIYNARIVTD